MFNAVVWLKAASTPIDFNTVIGAAEASEITLTDADGIDDKCQIVARVIDNASGAAHTYVLTPAGAEPCK